MKEPTAAERTLILTIDRSPMVGKSGRTYVVLGQDDVPGWIEKTDRGDLILSVTSPSNYPAEWKTQGRGIRVSYLAFWDVSQISESAWMQGIQEPLTGFVAARLKTTEAPRLIFQCEAGMSRSAGLCVAAARFFGDEEVAEECCRRYAPNELVAERLTEALRCGGHQETVSGG